VSLVAQETKPESHLKELGMDLTTGSIPKNLLVFSLPMLAGSILQTAYSLINAFWVGKYLGTNALAAITVSFPAVFVLMAIAGGLTIASNILVAQYVGAREWDALKKVIQTSIILVLSLSVVFLALGLIFSPHLLQMMNTPEEILPISIQYLRIFFWTLPFSFTIFLLGAILRGIGDSRTPLYFQAVSVALNTILDPVLIFGWVGLPRLGLNGTAYASILAQALVVIGLLIYIPLKRPLVSADWRNLRIDLPSLWLIFRIGFPAMVQQSVVSVSLLFIVSLVSAFGANADAAIGAAVRIDNVAFLPALTIGMAVSTLSGQNIGAVKYERVKEVFWWGILLSGGISFLISLLAVSMPKIFLKAFLSEPQVISIGADYLRIVGINYTLFAVMFVSNGVINGSGHTLPTTIITIIALWGIRIPIAYLLSKHLNDVRGVWYAMLLSVFCGMMISLFYYASGRWKKPVIKRQHGIIQS